MKEVKYLIFQGIIDKKGNGESLKIAEFESLRKAKKYFKKNKKDCKNFKKSPFGFLETFIKKIDLFGEVKKFNTEDFKIIDYYRFYY